jgi:hypothetical protein
MPTSKIPTVDPLYVIFEEHLYNFEDSDSDRKTFIVNVVHDYLTHLRKMNLTVPKSLEQPIVEELAEQVNTMLVKKIYGCLSIEEFKRRAPKAAKRRSRARYDKMRAQTKTTASERPARKRRAG